MIVKQTQRGFGRIEFKDRYDVACSLQKSSLASEDCIWFGCDDADPKVCIPGKGWQKVQLPEDCVTNTRMHLTRKQAKCLLPHLQAFTRTGEIEIIPPTKTQLWRKVARCLGEVMMPCRGMHYFPNVDESQMDFIRRMAAVDDPAARQLQKAITAWEAAE